MPIVPPTSKNIKIACELLKKGEVIAFPTETVYGLGAIVFNEKAVAKIFEMKRRPYFDPLIVHIADINMLEDLCYFNEKAQILAKKFWPGPLTMILPKKEKVPSLVTAGLSTVAVRMPAHKVALQLIKTCGIPIAAPSANPFGKLSPTKPEHVYKYFGEELFIIDGGKCDIGLESTIIDLTEKNPVILRPGAITPEELEKVLGKIEINTCFKSQPKSPGNLKKHYAPNTPIKIIDNKKTTLNFYDKKIGYIAFSKPPSEKYEVVKILSPSKDLKEAATNLFDFLHELDKLGLDLILVEALPEQGLGIAIMDRLRKAEATFIQN